MQKVATRSQNAPNYSALAEFFKTTDRDTEGFVTSLQDIIQDEGGGGHDSELLRSLISGKPDMVRAPKKLSEQLSGFVRIIHGWHRDDYVWHIEHAAIRKPWKVPDARVIYIVAKIMHEILPNIDAKIWPPQDDWELRTITFKAIGLAGVWSFEESSIDKINGKLFEVLNTVV